jgi:hypothetical protein
MVSDGSGGRHLSARVEAVDARAVDAFSDRHGGRALSQPINQRPEAGVGTFIGNVISVALLAWPFMPLTIRALKWWLLPVQDRAWWINSGIALVIALYAVELAALWDWAF